MGTEPERIILLSADSLRADHLSCYGYHRNTSPNLDKLSKDGLQFLNAHSVSSHTREAVPGLITGEYPDRAVTSDYHLSSDSIASTLTNEGFATAAFHSNPFISRAFNFDKGFDTFDDDLRLSNFRIISLAQRWFDKLRNRHYARGEEINNNAFKWIDSLDSDKPFFIWNHYMDTHGPYEPPSSYHGLFGKDLPSNSDAYDLYKKAINAPQRISVEEREQLINLYDSELRYFDEQIGDFISGLQERGLFENSMLIFTSDHGTAFGENGYYEHPRYLHDELTHVPLLIHHPDEEHRQISTPVSTLDIADTIESQVYRDKNETNLSLRDSLPDDRHVYQQTRKEDQDSHIRLYSIKNMNESCYCKYNNNTGSLSFENCDNNVLKDKLESHVRSRLQSEQEVKGGKSQGRDAEIDRRLEALGYKE